jgi:hypothetical protein
MAFVSKDRKGACSRPPFLIIVFAAAWFVLHFLFPGDAGSADWKWLGKDAEDCQWYVDAGNVKQLSEGKMLVWLKRVVTDAQRNRAVWDRLKERLPAEGYDRWAYEQGLMELDCRAATIRQLSVYDYDRDGMLLKARKIGDNLKAISRDTIGEMLYREICGPKEVDPRNVTPRFPSRW